ncbi:ATP-binding protein [Streptomyces zagrosensis]|uniref:Anti-sigma regulatory factor (Ser/Thr protein kinase) n=1 Tax=Streptomyces zagrosensis TaxID=1042984 RepID=A0A7W9Q7I9_9ACTN|nr:ATP-binding protein [Streptomyces zagrosensis]MBB5935066.1 anti-sigma regulatory factor (Ser/Thr protein kinase) [Streptomyces zagrosensis]
MIVDASVASTAQAVTSVAPTAVTPQAPLGTWRYTLHLPHSPLAPSVARATVRTVLRAHGPIELTDRAELLVSELASNAYRYARGPASLRISWRAGVLRISVRDSSPQFPDPPGVGEWDLTGESGRGLRLVSECSDAWDCYRLTGRGRQARGSGKVVWCELTA